MPELPEVQRAVGILRRVALNAVIAKVQTVEDNLVFAGTNHEGFAKELTGRQVLNVARYGKVFYMELDGHGKMPVMHFGMTGNLHVKGDVPLAYQTGSSKVEESWPPRFMKFIMHLKRGERVPETEVAFVDPRRLGRIRLCQEPLKELPISALGFDPILGMPSEEWFHSSLVKRSCPIKALLLNQSFSAGVGNWIADEVLYHARIHPEQRCNTVSQEQSAALHESITTVCQTAVAVDADSNKFPENWLFKHRWGKGKRAKETAGLKLPSGDMATIKWITVGGRTSAYVPELQRLVRSAIQKSPVTRTAEDDESDDLTPLSDEVEQAVDHTKKRRKRSARSPKKRKTS